MYKDKKAIKRDILDKFRTLGIEQDLLPSQWLETDYFESLDSEEKKLFKKAIQELVSSGLVEQVQGPVANLRLTQKGADLIH
jgi:uncharacterized protein YaaW (UPF0174 family)